MGILDNVGGEGRGGMENPILSNTKKNCFSKMRSSYIFKLYLVLSTHSMSLHKDSEDHEEISNEVLHEFLNNILAFEDQENVLQI